MTHAAKRLGTVLAAILALGALAASPAWGAEEFHSEKEKTIITGEQDATGGRPTLEIEGGLKVECSKFKAEGVVTGTKTAENLYTSPSATVRPEYSGSPSKGGTKCDSFLGPETVEVKSSECLYSLGAATVKEGHALVTVVCPKGQAIEIVGGGLTIKLTGGPENLFGGTEINKNLTGVHYVNKETGSKRAVTIEPTVAGIHYTCEPEFTCFLAGVASTGNNAKFIGNVTTKGFEDVEATCRTENGQVGIWKE